MIGVTLAVLSAIANFFFIPYYPFWAILIIALDVWVIWALTRSVSSAEELTTYGPSTVILNVVHEDWRLQWEWCVDEHAAGR